MIYLINPFITSRERYGKNIGDIGGHQMPLGIYYLAAYLLKCGEEVKVIDCEALRITHEQLVPILKEHKAKVVGITCATVSFHRARSLAELIRKELPDIRIVIGGYHISALPEATMLTGAFDYGIIQEGEIAFLKLIKFLLHQEGRLGDIPNLYYMDKGRLLHNQSGKYIQDLDILPFPARQLCPDLSIYKPPLGSFRKEPVMNMVTSRGCPYECLFCDRSTFGRQVRFFSAEYVVKEIKELMQIYGAKEITFLDDTFVLSKSRLYRIFELLNQENISFPWTCMTRVNNLDYDTLKFMADNGCWQIRFGIESGNEQVINFIKKGITLQQVKDVTSWCKSLKIKTTGFFMIGHHIDTPETIKETIVFALSLSLTDIIVTLNTPMPGTKSYQIAKHCGIFNEEDWSLLNYWHPVFIPRGLTSEFMLVKQKELYRRFYWRPKIILQQIEKIRSWKIALMYIYNLGLGIKFTWADKGRKDNKAMVCSKGEAFKQIND